MTMSICLEKKMKPFIVVSDGFDKSLFEELRKVDGLDVYPKSKVTPEELSLLLPKVNALVIRSATNVTGELLDKAPNLKYVIRAGEGTDNIDKKLCAAKGVKVSNTPGANNNSAAEHAFALMFTVLRSTAQAHQTMKEGKWEKSKFVGYELWKKKIGIVGFGRIGKILATRLQGFEPNIMFYDPFCNDWDIPNVKKVDNIDELFKNSDIITIHVPLSDKTRNLVDKKLLGLMKKDAIIVNAARGGVVNESDIYDALKAGKIAGAGFDVFESEPPRADFKLKELDNFVMTPHLGASTAEAQLRVGEMCITQLQDFFLHNKLVNEVKA